VTRIQIAQVRYAEYALSGHRKRDKAPRASACFQLHGIYRSRYAKDVHDALRLGMAIFASDLKSISHLQIILEVIEFNK
jgi:hypothetical protein